MKHGVTLEFLRKKIIEYIERPLSDDEEDRLNKFYKNVKKKITHLNKKDVYTFFKYELLDLESRFESIPPRDSASLKSCVLRYGDIHGPIEYEKRRKSASNNKEKLIKKHGLEKYKEIAKKKSINKLEYWVGKYGQEEGIEKYADYTKRRIEKFKVSIKKVRNGSSFSSYFERCNGDLELATKKYNDAKASRHKRFKLDYWIEKYGDELGHQKFDEFKKAIHLQLKEASRIGIEMKEKNKVYFGKNYSKSSQKFFFEILSYLPQEIQDACLFGMHGGEEFVRIDHPKKKYGLLDFKCGFVVIEYGAHFWHKDKIEGDKIKKEFLVSHGYHVLEIDENSFKKNKADIIFNTVSFIKENWSKRNDSGDKQTDVNTFRRRRDFVN